MSFSGRVDEMDELGARLRRREVVLLTGPPGIGKSALAERIGPSCWVDLGGAHTSGEALGRLARALDCPVETGAAVRAAAASQPWIVFDGAEDAAPGAAVDAVRGVCGALITSRRRLDLDATHLELGPLGVDDGVALLLARVGVRRARELDPAGLRALVGALDGVPLALELIASRLRLHGPAELLGRWSDGLGPLLEGVRAARRGCSVEAARVLDLAALHPGPFDVARLAALAGAPVDDAVLELLDASLIHPLPGVHPRFRVLGPVRAALEPGDRAAGIARLAEVVLPAAEAQVPRLEVDREAARLLGAEAPVLEALLEHTDPAVRLRAALVLGAREQRTGPLRATLERDARVGTEGPPDLRVAWALAVAMAASHLGEPDLAEDALARVAPLLSEGDRARWQAQRAVVWVRSGRTEEGLAEAASVASTSDPIVVLRVGLARFYAGALEGAVGPLRWAFDHAESPYRRAQAGVGLTAALRDLGEPPDLLAAELARIGDHDLPWMAPRVAFVRGVVAADRGDLAAARRALGEAASGLTALGEPADGAIGLAWGLGLLDGEAGPELPDSSLGRAWRAVSLAAEGQRDAALELGLPALDAVGGSSASELGALLAVGLGPGPAAARVLDGRAPHRLITLARDVLAGGDAAFAPRVEDRLLAALARRTPSRVVVAGDGAWFVGPDGARVDIAGRRVLSRVLGCLAEASGPLSVDAICARVWPGEHLVGESGTRRVHVAISTLRGLGLRAAIHTVTQPDGTTGWELVAPRAPAQTATGGRP